MEEYNNKRKFKGTEEEVFKRKKKEKEFVLSVSGNTVIYEWSYEALKDFEINSWLKSLNQQEANDLFPYELKIELSEKQSNHHKVSFERSKSKAKEEYDSFWEWKTKSLENNYEPFSIPLMAYIKKWKSDKLQYVPLQHMIITEERSIVGNRHNFFDRCRIYLAFIRFLKRALEHPDLFPWLMWSHKVDWNIFTESMFSKLWIYFAPCNYITSSIETSTNIVNSNPIVLKPWNKNQWDLERSLYYGWIDPLEWNHLGILRIMNLESNLYEPNCSKIKDPLSFDFPSKNETKQEQEYNKHSNNFIDDARNNSPYLFFIPKITVIPFWSCSFFDQKTIINEKEREKIAERLSKDFGKLIFGLNHSPILLNNDFTTCIKIFHNIDRVVRYCTEPMSALNVSLSGLDSIESKLEDICEWIQSNPHWPEIEWISFKQYKEHMKRGDCLNVDGRDARQIEKLIQQIECFGSDRCPILYEEKEEPNLLYNLPCGLMICAGEPQGLKIIIKMQHPIISARSIFATSKEYLLNNMRSIENFENSIEDYWKNISIHCEKQRKDYEWFSKKIVLWKNLISKIPRYSSALELPLVGLDLWYEFLKLGSIQELEEWFKIHIQSFYRYENNLLSNEKTKKWRMKLSIMKNPKEYEDKLGKQFYDHNSRIPPWLNCPKMTTKKPTKLVDKKSFSNSNSIMTSFIAFENQNSLNQEDLYWSSLKWKRFERSIQLRRICCFFPGAFLNHTYQAVASKKDIWYHMIHPMLYNSIGKIQKRNSEFLPKFDPKESLSGDGYLDIYYGLETCTLKFEKIWRDWINCIQDNIYFEEWELDQLTKEEEDKRMVWELTFWFFLIYDHLVYTPLSWKLRTPFDWWKDFLYYKMSRILPIGWKGGDIFVALVGFMTGREIKTINDVINHPFFCIWKKEKDLTRNYQLGIKEYEYAKFHPKERDYLSMFESQPLLKDNIILSSSWKDNQSIDSALHIISVITKSLKLPDYQIHTEKAKNSIPFRIQTAQNFLDIGQGRGVEQQCITMYWESIEKLKMFDWFSMLKENNPSSSSSLSNTINNNQNTTTKNEIGVESFLESNQKRKIDPSVLMNCSWKENSHHTQVLGFLLNYALIHEIKFHLNQPPLFWKLLSFRPELEPIQIQDLYDIEPKFCLNKFELYYLSDKELSEDYAFSDFPESEMSFIGSSFPITQSTVHLYLKSSMQEFIQKKVSLVLLNSLRNGFFTTLIDYKPSYRILYNQFYDPSAQQIDPPMILRVLKIINSPSLEGMKHQTCIYKDHIISSNNSICPISALVKFIWKLDSRNLKKFLYFITGSPLLGCAGDSSIYIIINEKKHDELPTTRTCGRILELCFNSVRKFSSVEESRQFYESKFTIALEASSSFDML